MPAFKDLTGQTFGKLVVLNRGPQKGRFTGWNCRCECGAETVVAGIHLNDGHTQSCGCLHRPHGESHQEDGSRTPEYRAWLAMRSRCNSLTRHNRKDYGGRGITVCDRWDSFETFLEDMGRKPSLAHTLERRKVNEGYSPSNCYWATMRVQENNRRNTPMLTFNGETMALSFWAEKLGFDRNTLFERLRRGWSVERTLSTPVH